MADPRADARGRVQSVERALAVLDLVVSRGGAATGQELVTESGLPAATVHRLCATLVESGYLRRDADRAYVLGPRLHRAGDMAVRATRAWVEPVLADLVAATGETANLAVREGDGVVYLAQVPSPHSMRMFTEVGRRVQIHCTAVGKALAALEDDAGVAAVLARGGMPAHTPATITRPGAYLRELAGVRRRGYATDESEQEEGVRCVAIAAGSGPSAVAVSVSGPEARFTPERRDAAVEVLRHAAARLAG